MRFAKFTIDYTKRKAKEKRKQQVYLESELKKLENNLENSDNLRKYERLKNDFELIYDHVTGRVRLRRARREVNKILFKHTKTTSQSRIRKLIVNEKEINNETEILNQIKLFYETLFQKSFPKG